MHCPYDFKRIDTGVFFSKRTEMNLCLILYLEICIVFKKDQTWHSFILKYTIFGSF